MQALDPQIRVHGWALVQVKDESTTWCYTVGLLEHFDHPELALIDVDLEFGSRLMTELVEGVTTRGVVSPWLLRREGLRCIEVHPDHLRGDLFGTGRTCMAASCSPATCCRCSSPTMRTASGASISHGASTYPDPPRRRLAHRTARSDGGELVAAVPPEPPPMVPAPRPTQLEPIGAGVGFEPT